MSSNCFVQFFCLLLLVSEISSHAATIVQSLPGYPGNLPFKLETGYIGVGEDEQIQLLYYFIESERDPERDPILLWHNGGPGCSALSALMFEIGPLTFNHSPASWQSEEPKLELNPYSWTKVASILSIDWPVGTGFSYSTTSEGYYTDDLTASRHNYEFLKKWLEDHVQFQKNPIYVSGDSYSGMVVPIIIEEILHGNKAGVQPLINLKGYILGNPYNEKKDTTNAAYDYAHRVSLLSDELYESASINCNGNFDDLEAANPQCKTYLQIISNNLDPLFTNYILEHKCNVSTSNQTSCWEDYYPALDTWANNIPVRQALSIREGTIKHWMRCNRTLPYEKNVESSFDYHQRFTKESLHALVYSGDQDLLIPYVGTLEWIRKLNVPIIDDWRPWFFKGQIAGYATKYSNGHYHLTFATVKGAGHTAPEYKRPECLHMLTNWLRVKTI